MEAYYIYSDLVYGTYVIERIGSDRGKICGILKYPSQRAPANKDVVREIKPYSDGTIKFFKFDCETHYSGELMSYREFQLAAIESAIEAAKGDDAVQKILCRHLWELPTYINEPRRKGKKRGKL